MNDVQIFLGAEGIKRAYDESLSQSYLDIVCLASAYEHVIGDYFDKHFAPNIYGKIHTREILPDSPGNKAAADTKDRSMNTVRFIKSGIASESDMLVWNDRVILISFGATPMAIVIHEREIVENLKFQFDALWNKLV